MTGQFAEFHDELRSVAGGVLAKGGGWHVLADAGWTGFEVPEELGGAGASFAETAVICEEIGRAAAETGYLGGLLSVGALAAVAPGGTRDELLSGIAVGQIRSAVVLDGFELRDGKLYGAAEFVPDVAGADRILVVAGNALALAPTGLTVTPQPVVDETRSLATVSADGVPAAEVLPFEAAPQLRDRAAVAVACDSLGLAQAMLDATVSYVKVRHQFGRPIGSFQAVKHACADMMVSLAVSITEIVPAPPLAWTWPVPVNCELASSQTLPPAPPVELVGEPPLAEMRPSSWYTPADTLTRPPPKPPVVPRTLWLNEM